MGVGPQRAFPRRRARARPRDERRLRARRGRQGDCHAHRLRRQYGLLFQSVRRPHPVVRDRHGDRRLRHPGGPRGVQRRVHQHRSNRCLSRRRPSGSGVPGGAADGRGGPRHGAFGDRDPPPQFHQAGADALQDTLRERLRHRRVRRASGQGAGRSRRPARSRSGWRRRSRAAVSAGSGVCTYVEICAFAGSETSKLVLEADGTRERAYRHAVERAGAQDRLRAVRRRSRSGSTTTRSTSCRATPTSWRRAAARAARAPSPSARRRSAKGADQLARTAEGACRRRAGGRRRATSSWSGARRAWSAPTAASPTPTSPRAPRTSRS